MPHPLTAVRFAGSIHAGTSRSIRARSASAAAGVSDVNGSFASPAFLAGTVSLEAAGPDFDRPQATKKSVRIEVRLARMRAVSVAALHASGTPT